MSATPLKSHRAVLAVAIALSGATAFATSASALSLGVTISCAADYARHCSSFNPLSKEVRKCMYDAGPELSKGCVDALLDAGEVTEAEIAARKAAMETAAR